MQNGFCKVGPCKCHHTDHVNMDHYFKSTVTQETKTFDDRYRNYIDAKDKRSKTEQVLSKLAQEQKEFDIACLAAANKVKEIINELNLKALKPQFHDKEEDYLQSMIETEEMERKAGYENRISYLKEMSRKQIILKDLIGKDVKNPSQIL